MAILVTGGAGYIGSVMVELLRSRAQKVVVLDNLTRGHRAAVDQDVPFYQGCIGDRELVTSICREHGIDACIHFAALAYVGESVSEPRLYFENNVEKGIALLSALIGAGVRNFVFSSTCATYGEPLRIPIDEGHPQQPANPYGWSKFFFEKILAAYDHAYGLHYVALRYFNAAGATRDRGEHHHPETHIIPNVLFTALGRLPRVTIFGGDYPTPDGTAIRDYVHVSDLCSAHLLALNYLRDGGRSESLNLGTGQGYSVMELIETARKVTKCPIEVEIAPRRPGDPSRLIADSQKARSVLGWNQLDYPDLKSIIASAWEWHQAHPDGYGS
ncbi:MAG: UDP-glucose 4-epimerase GalE [Blastocatellia bacterium]|nr:UDP-glucose 4-epimerase GalE [Blastocatellia bacterium]